MLLCKHSLVINKTCNGQSDKILCERDMYIKCFIYCYHDCPLYEATNIVRSIDRLSPEQKQLIVNPQEFESVSNTTSRRCGGCNTQKQLNSSQRTW